MVNSAQLNTEGFYTLHQTAKILKVSIETLIEWNDNNILKPAITRDGIVVYKREQIDKFLIAQQILKERKSNFVQTNPINRVDTSRDVDSLQAENEKVINKPLKVKGAGLRYVGATFFLIFFIIISTFLFKEQNITGPLLDNNIVTSSTNSVDLNANLNTKSDNVNLSSANDIGFNSETNSALTENDLDFVTSNTSKNDYQALVSVFENSYVTTPVSKIKNDQIMVLSEDIYELNNLSEQDGGTINPLGNLVAKPNVSGTNSPLSLESDTRNIDTLAINIESPSFTNNENLLKQNSISILLFITLALGLVSAIFIFKNQFSYSLTNTGTTIILDNNTASLENNKMIEVDQKTDGTVVLYLQGKEYKISKPELNSESDQFIERLLEYAPPEVKEISYNILEDKGVSLNAPLSKIVTRLGFVGLKRELFFPRTSKNSVLFRRYLTQEDVRSMNINIDQIESELNN